VTLFEMTKEIQRRVGVAQDGVWGRDSAGAVLTALGAGGSPATAIASGSPVDLVSVRILRAACPERSEAQLLPWVGPIKAACRRFDIDTIRRVAAFISQMAHESGLIPGREEDLRYSAKRMAEVWARYAVNPGAKPKDRQPNALAQKLAAAGPQAIANDIYANRMGNGPPASGDGWKNRGAGPGQLTGADNWRAFARAMGMTHDEALAFGRTVEGGVMAFAWFWEENDINRLADTPGVEDETRRINGGQHGVDDRRARMNRTVAALIEAEKGQ
jgi:putative chitinase